MRVLLEYAQPGVAHGEVGSFPRDRTALHGQRFAAV